MLETINGYIWGFGLLVLLLGTGLYVTVKTGFFQIRGIPVIVRSLRDSLRTGGKRQRRVTASALAASMGTGNIAGVSAAMAIGGAGAIFWMYISAFLGMSLTYAENLLSAKYSKGKHIGPMGYIRYGLGSGKLAGIYAVLCICASLGMGNMTQSSTAALAMEQASGVPVWITGIAAALAVGLSVMGGVKSIGKAAGILLPVVSAAYMGTALAVIAVNYKNIPEAFAEIFGSAFGTDAFLGGTAGAAISAGLRHGVFSNEAGLGSSGIIHSEGEQGDGRLQGMWSMAEVFLDTFICCTLTALALLCTHTKPVAGMSAVSEAFSCILGSFSASVSAVMAALFALCTMLGWCCCGEKAVASISEKKSVVYTYRCIFCLCTYIGAVGGLWELWALSDIANGLMAVPNLLAVLVLTRKSQLCRKQ